MMNRDELDVLYLAVLALHVLQKKIMDRLQ